MFSVLTGVVRWIARETREKNRAKASQRSTANFSQNAPRPFVTREYKLAYAKHAPTAFNSKRRWKKLAIVARVLQNTWKLIIPRCCFEEDGKEMYQDSKRTCTAIVLLIKPFALWLVYLSNIHVGAERTKLERCLSFVLRILQSSGEDENIDVKGEVGKFRIRWLHIEGNNVFSYRRTMLYSREDIIVFV